MVSLVRFFLPDTLLLETDLRETVRRICFEQDAAEAVNIYRGCIRQSCLTGHLAFSL